MKGKKAQRGTPRLAALFAVLLLAAAFYKLAVRAPEPAGEAAAVSGAKSVSDAVPDDGAGGEAEPQSPVRTRRDYCYNILVSGLDDDNGGSDTNILMRFDAPNRRIDLVSLPRDTLLHHEWYSNKLNYAYAAGGVERLRQEVSNLLGVPVDYYVTVDLRGFVTLVDQIGGVDFDVPADMDYDDPAQGLHIHYAKGPHHLNGRQAMEVVRWRKNNDGSGYADADIGRIGTQQAFLKALAERVLTVRSVPALAEVFFSHVNTDLSIGNLVWLGSEARGIGMEGVSFHTLPGDGAGWYRRESVYVLDPEATLTLVNEALNPYNEPISADDTDILVP